MNELNSWLKSKGHLRDGVELIDANLGDGYLVESSLSAEQKEALCNQLSGPPADCSIFKNGSRSLVCGYKLSGAALALKFYYRLSLRRRIGYSLWGSRAMRAWAASRAFTKIGIMTPRPVALIEKRQLGVLYDSSLLVTEIADGTPLLQFVEDQKNNPDALKKVAQSARNIFSEFAKHQIYHGDTNPKNFIVTPDLSLSVLDLDAVMLGLPKKTWLAKRPKDEARFARLWQDRPDLKSIFIDIFDHSV